MKVQLASIQVIVGSHASLVGIDPRPEETDTAVDGGERRIALRLTPWSRSDQNATTYQRATTVTAACADWRGLDADVSIVDLGRWPGAGACSVGQNRHCTLLQCIRNSTGSARSSPSGDCTTVSGVVSGACCGHCDVTRVTVCWDVGKVKNSYVVRIALVSIVDKTSVPRERCKWSESAGSTVGDGTVCGTM